MIKAACHCTAIRLELPSMPTWVVDCNCTLCRRYGAIWAYYKPGEVIFVAGADGTDSYAWADRNFSFHWCRECGCLTHHTALNFDPPYVRAINARMIPTLNPASVTLQHTDNSHTGWFWTRPADKYEPGGEPKMDLPEPEDWR